MTTMQHRARVLAFDVDPYSVITEAESPKRLQPYDSRTWIDQEYDLHAARLLDRSLLRMEYRLSELIVTQHEKTRSATTSAASESREYLEAVIRGKGMTLVDCFRINPAANAKLAAAGIGLAAIFSLVLSATVHVHLLHPLFAILLTIVSAGFYLLGTYEESRLPHPR